MVRRIWALVLTAVLVLGAIPVAALAANEDALLTEKTRKSYEYGLETSGKESFFGLCGTMVGYQLRYFGITAYPELWDGNKQFDKFAVAQKTSGGYYVEAYPAQEFTLEEALNLLTEYGTKSVQSILVGFESTHTEAGQLFGHACVITGILDGTVYFTESFDTAYGPEGTVIRLPLEQFVEFYSGWTTFDGVVHFCDTYAEACVNYPTDIFVRTRFAQSLRSQPRLVGQDDCTALRTLSAGERLRVDAVLKDYAGQLYYQVLDGDRVGYIVAQAAILDRVNVETLAITELLLPETLDAGQVPELEGTVSAAGSLVGAVELALSNSRGEVVFQERKIADAHSFALSAFNESLRQLKLEADRYTLTVSGQTAAAYVREDALDYTYATLLLTQKTLWVGMEPQNVLTASVRREEAKDGWLWENGTWYCYKNGRPCTGWTRNLGVAYYLQEDGSVTTGWAEIDGQTRCFSATGALCVGWLTTEEGTRYAFSDGSFAEGWQTIGAFRYYFDEGLMQTKGTRSDDGQKYEFRADGRAILISEETKE